MRANYFFKFNNASSLYALNKVKKGGLAITYELLIIVVSAFVLSTAFPGLIISNGAGFLVFVALIPSFYVINKTTLKLSALYGFVYGFVFYRIFNHWLSDFQPLADILLPALKGFEMAALFFFLKLANDYINDKYLPFVQSAIWVSYAYFSQSWFGGYPYGSLAYALYKYVLLIQVASFSGIWMITFIIVLPQSLLGMYFSKHKSGFFSDIPLFLKRNKLTAYFFLFIFVFQIIFGIIRLSNLNKRNIEKVRNVILIQHNANPNEMGAAAYKKGFEILKRLSLEAVAKHPDADLLVWPETAFVPSINWYSTYRYSGKKGDPYYNFYSEDQNLVNEFIKFEKELKIPLLTGNVYSLPDEDSDELFPTNGEWNRKDYNGAILFEDGKISDVYLKQRLVPFSEYFPNHKEHPFITSLLTAIGCEMWYPGKESKVMRTYDGLNFSAPICFEDVFGYIVAEFADKGAELIINLTNDSWSKSIDAENQHAYIAVFRAVETGLNVLRCTNSGITCNIMPNGKIIDRIDPFVEGYEKLTVPIYSTEKKTLYVIFKDVPVKICSFLTLALMLYILVKFVLFGYTCERNE